MSTSRLPIAVYADQIFILCVLDGSRQTILSAWVTKSLAMPSVLAPRSKTSKLAIESASALKRELA